MKAVHPGAAAAGVAVTQPRVVIFDVNETLSDMAPLSDCFADIGAPGALAATWFAAVLRDGFALTVVGESATFSTVASEVLRGMLSTRKLQRPLDDAVDHVMEALTGLSVHRDVVPGVRALRHVGADLVTLSNGSASTADGLLGRAGIRDDFEELLSVEDAGAWKPSAQAYGYAARRCGVAMEEALLVAVHPWDIDGAARAGMATAWLNRTGATYPRFFRDPELTVHSVGELAQAIPRRRTPDM